MTIAKNGNLFNTKHTKPTHPKLFNINAILTLKDNLKKLFHYFNEWVNTRDEGYYSLKCVIFNVSSIHFIVLKDNSRYLNRYICRVVEFDG